MLSDTSSVGGPYRLLRQCSACGLRAILAAGLLLSVTACGSRSDQHRDARTAAILYSPNAEPLTGGALGHPSCSDALGQWFDRLDRDHSQGLSRAVFLADAEARFSDMDLDHDGWITPAELDRYRQPYEPPLPRVGPTAEGGGRPHRPPQPSGTRMAEDADPVMSADLHLQFRVSRADFLAQANDIFGRLDSGHHDRLSRADILALCRSREK